jgi:hypothetical protein
MRLPDPDRQFFGSFRQPALALCLFKRRGPWNQCGRRPLAFGEDEHSTGCFAVSARYRLAPKITSSAQRFGESKHFLEETIRQYVKLHNRHNIAQHRSISIDSTVNQPVYRASLSTRHSHL